MQVNFRLVFVYTAIALDSVRQGEKTRFRILINIPPDLEPEDGATVSWSVQPAEAGFITAEGDFVGYRPGPAQIVAAVANFIESKAVTVGPRNGLQGAFEVVAGDNQIDRFNSDLWLFNNFAYTGTWRLRGEDPVTQLPGDRMFVWDITNPVLPLLSDTVIVDAQTVNDVKIRADGTLAVITHEGSVDELNGITLLDLTDPLNPTVITRFTDGLEPGVHNVWIEGNYVYAVADGPGNGLRIIDISDPFTPFVTATFVAETSFLHDVQVRDGLAILSHWDDGLIILDVGHGIVGGSPENPVEVSRIRTAGDQTHNAWYWPAGGYVFVGEEDFEAPGKMHVIDVQDLFAPREVATFAVPETTPHNFWLDEERGILYAAWYSAGLHAIDVNGELLGELEKQGREIAAIDYGTDSGCQSANGTCTWAPQLHNGLIFITDMNTGLWAFDPQV